MAAVTVPAVTEVTIEEVTAGISFEPPQCQVENVWFPLKLVWRCRRKAALRLHVRCGNCRSSYLMFSCHPCSKAFLSGHSVVCRNCDKEGTCVSRIS